jgi:signal transduction histidine kinase
VESDLYRIAQEALSNVRKHSGGRCVRIQLAEEEQEMLTLEVQDDGKGFVASSREKRSTFGLLGMRERAEMIGGILSIKSSKGSGTTVLVHVPLKRWRGQKS